MKRQAEAMRHVRAILVLASLPVAATCARTEVHRVVVALPISQNEMDWERCIGAKAPSGYSITLDAFARPTGDAGAVVVGTSPCEGCFGANPARCTRVSASRCVGSASGAAVDLRRAFESVETSLGAASQGLCLRAIIRAGTCDDATSRVVACMLNGAPQNLNANTQSISLDQPQCSALDQRCESVAMQCGTVRQSLRDGPLRDQLDGLCGEASRSICGRLTAEECAIPR